jgi:hypothetical protein
MESLVEQVGDLYQEVESSWDVLNDDILRDYLKKIETWNSLKCQSCDAMGYFTGIRFNTHLPYFCDTCCGVVRSFLRNYRKYHVSVTLAQRKLYRVQYRVMCGTGMAIESTNEELTQHLMAHFVEYMENPPHGIYMWQDRGIWLLESQPSQINIMYGSVQNAIYDSNIMLYVFSQYDVPAQDNVAPSLTWALVKRVRDGHLTLNETVVSDIDRYIFDSHNGIIALRYMFIE